MAIEPVKIPQNVDVEDRIFGPVTLRQLFLTLAGAGVSYALYALMKKAGSLTLITGIMAWTPLVITIAFAFVKINGISLFKFTLLLSEKSQMPTVRYWQPRKGVHLSAKSLVPKKKSKKDMTSQTEKKFNEISELSNVLDSGPILEKKEKSEQKKEPAVASVSPQNDGR